MAVSARTQGTVPPPLRVLVALLGLLVPLHLPFTVPELGTEKTLGWWSTGWGGDGAGLLVTQTTWYVRTSGLAPGDRVLSVDGRPASKAVVQEVLRTAPVGDSVELVVHRGGRVLTLHVNVLRSSVSYVGYWWFRLALVLGAWLVGMALVVWQGRWPPAFVLGTALLLVSPVIVTVAVPLQGGLARFVNSVWQHQATAYRFLFPALLAHFAVLQPSPGPRTRPPRRWVWAAAYGAALVALALSTELFRDPLAWTRPGPARVLRTVAGLGFEVAAVATALLLLRGHRPGASTLRWLLHSLVLYLLVGVLISLLILAPGTSPAFLDSVRQLKTLGLLLLVVTAAIYCLSLRDGEPSDWALRGRLSTTASMALTALFGFAVAAAAAVVHARERALGEMMEVLLFLTIFVAAIAFSPVLRWAREMVDRQMLARWADLEARVGKLSDGLGSELEPARIAERVSRELPGLLGLAEAELVLSRELVAGWGLADEDRRLHLECAGAVRAELAAAPDPLRPVAPIRRPDGEPIGVLRLRMRPGAPALEPPEQRALASLVRGLESSLRSAEAYLRLRHAQGELADAERVASLGALAGGLAHEIKNPLMGLKLGLHLLAKDGGNPERLHRIASDVRRIDDLVTGLLRFTHDDFREEVAPVDVPELVRGCVREMRPLAEDRTTEIRESYPEGGAVVRASGTQLRLVVGNLVKNALDAVREDGAVDVSVLRSPSAVEIRVEDNGPGIPRELRERIFDLAFSTKPGGSGIGLALARRETERMGGRIEVETEPGDGTTLRVLLPPASAGPRRNEPQPESRA
jgi:signal transduction histidine kinase